MACNRPMTQQTMALFVFEVSFFVIFCYSYKTVGYGNPMHSPIYIPTKQKTNTAEKFIGLDIACQPVPVVPVALELLSLFPIQVRCRPTVYLAAHLGPR